ncbi:putative ribonuclease H-like domain-containing protein, partial [Tanacetum coccineum]
EEYESDSDDECVYIPTKQQETPSFANQQVKTPKENVKRQNTHSQKPRVDKKELGHGFAVRACFVCGSLNHLIRDCDFHEKRMARKANLNNGWNNVHRVNKQNKFVPSAVLTRTGIIPVSTARASSTKNFSTARQSFNRQTVLTNIAMKVNTVKLIVNRDRPANVFHKTHSPTRPFKKTTVLRQKNSNQKFNTAKVNAVSTVGGKGKLLLSPQQDYPHRALKNKGIVDSGCSRHMTGNKAYLAEFQDFNGGPVAFGGSKGYITGKVGILYSKAFRVTILETKKIEEKPGTITFLEEQKPNVAGKGPTWIFDLDYLTDSMNYHPVRSENQANIHAGQQEANHHAGTEDIIDAGDLKKEDESAQDCFVLPYGLLILQQSLLLLKTMKRESTGHSNEGLYLSDPTNPEKDDSEIPLLEDIYQNSSDGIFTTSSYDDEDAVADFTNLETVVNVSPILTSRINSSHPSTLILGDPTSAVQTRSKVNKSSGAHAFVSYVQKQKRTNHKDFHHCLFAYFLSQHEPKKISEALEDESWKAFGTKWVDRNKKDERGFELSEIKARLLLRRYYCPQPPGFLDPKYPQKVYKVVKALYGLHQAPRAWYATLSTFLLKNGYRRVKQKADGIFISQDKYVAEILKKFDFANVKTASTPIETQKPLVKDEEASDVDVHLYRSMIGSLMYLTASRPNIMFAVCACSRFQVTPKSSHLSAVKRIFRYLKGKPKLGLWYPRVSSFDLESYSDSDYAGANLDRKSTTGGCQFLGRRLISWQCKKQTIVATSTTEAEYVAAASCCGQNPVYHSKTKHIAIRHHFIRDAYEKKLIQVLKIHTDDNVADLLTKAFDVSRESLRRVLDGTEALLLSTLFILWLDIVSTDSAKLVPLGKVCTAIETLKKNTAKALISLLTTITLSTTMAVLDSCPKHNMVAYLEKSEGNAELESEDFDGNEEDL